MMDSSLLSSPSMLIDRGELTKPAMMETPTATVRPILLKKRPVAGKKNAAKHQRSASTACHLSFLGLALSSVNRQDHLVSQQLPSNLNLPESIMCPELPSYDNALKHGDADSTDSTSGNENTSPLRSLQTMIEGNGGLPSNTKTPRLAFRPTGIILPGVSPDCR